MPSHLPKEDHSKHEDQPYRVRSSHYSDNPQPRPSPQPAQPPRTAQKQPPLSPSTALQAGLAMASKPPEYRDTHGHLCTSTVCIVPACNHAEKPLIHRVADCWECATLYPVGKCDPIPTVGRLPEDIVWPCHACMKRGILPGTGKEWVWLGGGKEEYEAYLEQEWKKRAG